VSAGVPLASLLLGWLWSALPITIRKHIKPGYETFAFIPVVLVLIAIFWSFGPVFERFAFVTTDPSGQKIADFRYWWPAVTGASFEQRNSLVVGLSEVRADYKIADLARTERFHPVQRLASGSHPVDEIEPRTLQDADAQFFIDDHRDEPGHQELSERMNDDGDGGEPGMIQQTETCAVAGMPVVHGVHVRALMRRAKQHGYQHQASTVRRCHQE
jgi:hypothetical protein